jgi:hypothetical protein
MYTPIGYVCDPLSLLSLEEERTTLCLFPRAAILLGTCRVYSLELPSYRTRVHACECASRSHEHVDFATVLFLHGTAARTLNDAKCSLNYAEYSLRDSECPRPQR